MGAPTLVTSDIEKGEQALRALDSSGVRVQAAMWFLQTEAAEWRLRLRMPVVDREGPAFSYKRVQDVLRKANIDLPVWSIQVVGSSDDLTSSIRSFIRTEKDAIKGIRVSHSSVANNYIEDAYIYRSS